MGTQAGLCCDIHALFVCFVALRPKSTAMVMAGRSVHLTCIVMDHTLSTSAPSLQAHTRAHNAK